MKFLNFVLILWMGLQVATAQDAKNQRSSLHFLYGPSGANIRDFNEMLATKGLSPLRKGYNSFGMAYQNRFNDFVLGAELIHNNGPTSDFRDYQIDYRSTRLYVNVGYAFTEVDQTFQLIHYMSLGLGYLNFEMLKDIGGKPISEFLDNPAHGFIIRQNDLHKGTLNMGGFLTEIGFQLGYHLNIPGWEEAFELVGKVGYSFSPFENAWNNRGISFDNIQSGAFLRLGAGIALPQENFFYRDASLTAHIFYGNHLTKPNTLNEVLEQHGYNPIAGHPHNVGLKIIGENRGRLYGLDVYNLSQKGKANEQYSHTLNSVRIYGNLGRKLFEGRSWELGVLGGVGYGNVRYTLMAEVGKPEFPRLFEEPDHDGNLKDWGFMAKPEVYLAYQMPISQDAVFDIVGSVYAGYELPLSHYTLTDLNMKKYMGGPYLQLGIGIKP
ncbi:MAG TPA: hypothetical protein VK014_06345 [Cyclobacteriaceae bacterium]|nr:hypothetical protein [Cyclobacteriaceae bacterium]